MHLLTAPSGVSAAVHVWCLRPFDSSAWLSVRHVHLTELTVTRSSPRAGAR